MKFVLFLALFVAGCVHKPPRQPPPKPPSVVYIRESTRAATVGTQSAEKRIVEAQEKALSLFKQVQVDLRPLVSELQGKLSDASSEHGKVLAQLEVTNQRTDDLERKVKEVTDQAIKWQQESVYWHAAYDKEHKQAQYWEKKHGEAVKKLWDYRIHSLMMKVFAAILILGVVIYLFARFTAVGARTLGPYIVKTVV